MPGARGARPLLGDTAKAASPNQRMLAEVLAGLSRAQKETSPKYFYDARGSALFETITELPEYYLTRTEYALLEDRAPGWIAAQSPAALVELGAGSSRKTRLLLDRLREGATYVPLDVSEAFLLESSAELRTEYPELRIRPHVSDIAATPLSLPDGLSHPALFAFLGSTLGNFTPSEAVRLLSGVRARSRPGDALLLGVDLRPGPSKPVARVEAAYNDAQGITAAFNRNVLAVLNEELGADFDPDAFEHRAFYDEGQAQIEMHLVSRRPQSVHFAGGAAVTLAQGETIRTEISARFDRPTLEALLSDTGFRLKDWAMDPDGLYALLLGEPA